MTQELRNDGACCNCQHWTPPDPNAVKVFQERVSSGQKRVRMKKPAGHCDHIYSDVGLPPHSGPREAEQSCLNYRFKGKTAEQLTEPLSNA